MFGEQENWVVLIENSVERKPCISRKSKSDELTTYSYSCHDINMKFLVVVTPPSIYHGCSTRKTFREEKFTGKKDLFQSMNMKNWGRRKFRKHKEIKGSNMIVTLDISEKFDGLNKMETTSSESKEELERSGKGLVTAVAFKTKVRSPKYKKARYAIGNFSEKDLSKIIKESEKIGKLPYEKRIPKHEPSPRYFHLVRQLAKSMMSYDQLNRHDHGSYAKKLLLLQNTWTPSQLK